MSVVCLDFETSTYNKGQPFDERNKAVSYSFLMEEPWFGMDGVPTHRRFDDLEFYNDLKYVATNASLFIGCNCKFDLHWLRNCGEKLPSSCRVWDVQLAEFILSGQRNSFASLNSLAELYSLPTKLDAVSEYWEQGVATEDIPPDVLEEYNNYDVELTYKVYLKQLEDPRMTPELKKLIMLQGLDLLVLQEMEWNGLKYNVVGSKEDAEKLKQELAEVDGVLQEYAQGINLDSGDQLSCFLFGGSITTERVEEETRVYKTGAKKGETYTRRRIVGVDVKTLPGFFTPDSGNELKKTKGTPNHELTNNTRYYSTDSGTLTQLKCKTKVQKLIVEKLQRRAYLQKLVSTYLEALPSLIEEMHWGDTLHPQYNQCQARTSRLSSSKPNAQNFPKEVDEYILSHYDS